MKRQKLPISDLITESLEQKCLGGADPTELHSNLLQQGYVHLPSLLTADELNTIQVRARQLLETASVEYSTERFIDKSHHCSPILFRQLKENTIFYDPLGVNPQFDRALEQLFDKPELISLLNCVLGYEYRLWHMLIRRSEPNAKNLALHQDLPGEVGLMILLDDTKDGLGTTCFLPRSHRWPRLTHTNTHIDPSWISFAVKNATGRAGEGYMFYNSTWHGVLNSNEEARLAIILTFIPTKMSPSVRIANADLISRVGKNLGSLLMGKSLSTQLLESTKYGPDDIVSGKYKVSRFSPSRLILLINFFGGLMILAYKTVRRIK